ncbi:phosphatidylglycerophosphatase A [Testudinibacter aquarius]|uniref:Phosphatidylglycerophosphatase A n=1 Tax=Testudinibacter aquarius TaxID=1524974 RepID=A0A4R3Y5X0_9PAST|nr:phosphatidylglycerophosphatase A [Testudinibacter aquarius]KAE9526357.1 phosphatidylglycerophosphatase [Testudinibacter aquarius]TCV87177.1 phosphatidylglycerophosphatase [Testudinibacter aquarius]TNG92458.1 phosphatidylglycerophosphatase A [Testudinibacter aquarius]
MNDKIDDKRSALNKLNIRNPVHFLALGFGSGLLSPAPGTWGTLAGWLLGIGLLQFVSPCFLLLLAAPGFVLGIYLCEKTAHDMGVHDHGAIVWDEIIAIWLVLAFAPQQNWLWYCLAFVLFRFFDIVKPYPIKYFDKNVENGLGIMLDDLLAAIYTALCLLLLFTLGGL